MSSILSLLLILLSLLAPSIPSTAVTLAVPGREQKHSSATNTTYYQGNLSPSSNCSDGPIAVAHGEISSDVRYTAYTYGIAIQSLMTRKCRYFVFQGSSNCAAEGSPSKTTIVELDKAGQAVYVATGVDDGGARIHASGMLKCG